MVTLEEYLESHTDPCPVHLVRRQPPRLPALERVRLPPHDEVVHLSALEHLAEPRAGLEGDAVDREDLVAFAHLAGRRRDDDREPLRSVLAFPKASRIGFACRIRSASFSTEPPPDPFCEPPAHVRKAITIFAVSVFPDPDSPEMITAWLIL